MSDSTVQFITQMKLRELHRQRAKLRESYQALGEQVAARRETADRLRKLYDGLRQLSFAGRPLHPDVANLQVLLYEAESGALSPDVLALWQRRLEDELAAGRLRSEFVYLFGALLEEWAREAPAGGRLAEESRRVRERLLRDALAEPEPHRPEDLLEALFADVGPALAERAQGAQERWRELLHGPVDEVELTALLNWLAGDIYQPPALRREARRFAGNDLLRKELADALTIMLAELHTWDWPAEGLATRALWTRNKWRLYLEEDLPTACLLDVVASRWVEILEELIGNQNSVTERRARLKKLRELNAPEVLLENERRMLRQAEQLAGLGLFEEGDVWDEEDSAGAPAEPESGSVIEARAKAQGDLRTFRAQLDYDGESGAGNAAVLLVGAEVRLARAAFPDRPLYVVKADLQDYYAGIPHDVLLGVLQRLGVAEADRAFIARFLAPPLQGSGPGAAKMRRGVPMTHVLSDVLAELLLRLLEKHVRQHARVRIVRLVDDICLLGFDTGAVVAGWRRVEEFCAACGLRVNPAKSGAVCLGGSLPEGLPRRRPRWGMLELDEAGCWHVHAETFAEHLAQARERVTAARSVLSRVQQYNANVKYLLGALAPGADLGDEHREAAGRALRQFHQDFFGAGNGIVAGLYATIHERFQPEASGIPEAWVHWPITAGGLGLRNPLVVAGQYAAAYRERKPPAAPAERSVGWNVHRGSEWAAYYRRLLERVEPVEPSETAVMKTLVDDFIARGADISAGRQQDLSAYWRWILYTYGPQILQRFGTFRFLITELVPLQLISRQLVRDTSLDDADRSADGAGEGDDVTA